ncbi:hypothetical protein NW754_009371 [Fusarium falciforme]|uniref:Hypothetical protein n=1 Tax=Fusarium falciforme TaxID=195108 RepID=UPI002301FDF5|nr:Hypothetical protein NCS54_00741700 [Fusarium falciforme]KAJ4157722.1 hypothetical protein NW754_009371 [Fusarium falciforme]KAJ4260807.1 hypothetical protein NW757_001190 [Fusarium falciforme]WAO90010.1 Hypothetical protein NCS54_00741700 [Fusarium falciforme]
MGSIQQEKVWATLVTNLNYLPGVLTLEYCLRRVGTEYPFVVLYTEAFPDVGREALKSRGIAMAKVPELAPSNPQDYGNDARFQDTWTKLAVFSLTDFERIVLLDSDMLVLQNMDELMNLELDHPSVSADASASKRVFASSHACVCNPLKRSHYPADWVPENCAFSSQHHDADSAQHSGASASSGLGKLNSGLLVVNPSETLYNDIVSRIDSHGTEYQFPDQDLLADLYRERWVPLPYVYNALKTMRESHVHGEIWRDDKVKNVHYILSPKPWDELDHNGNWRGEKEIHKWWVDANDERLAAERKVGIA